jgi:hypothetical protein
MIKNILLLFLLLTTWSITAQEVVSMQGNSYTNASISIDFTIGESVITTETDGIVTLTQGFHQIYFPLFLLLPIELLSFSAVAKETFVEINWITATEINNDYFNVERSADGINFSSINKIEGAGNSTQILNYSMLDDGPLEGKSYYRLKQTDYDGNTSYSNTEAVEFNTSNNFNLEIYPNPFSYETTFHTNESLKNASLIVYNSYKTLRQINNISGQKFTFQRENLSSGVYWIKLVQDKKVIAIEKLIIAN